jgi:hypothetical protein
MNLVGPPSPAVPWLHLESAAHLDHQRTASTMRHLNSIQFLCSLEYEALVTSKKKFETRKYDFWFF